MSRYLLPKGMSKDIHVRLEEHGTAVWNLIDGQRTVREIIENSQTTFNMKQATSLVYLLSFPNYRKTDLLNG